MNNYILETHGLTKRYKGVEALSEVSIHLEAGKIYGLIGPNGAGKTTLMRIIAGHTFPTGGGITLFGRTAVKELEKERKRLGCMIEYPSITANMTAKENLKLHRIMQGIPNQELEEELLGLLGLAEIGTKKAKDFSLGMKQRLGIAIALINNPELLVLDEPINGLDPQGVVEVRKLLKKLCEERQMAILISSHNLPELYQTATDYIIIHKGVLKQSLTLEQLDGRCQHHLLISCNQPERLVSVLEMELKTTKYKVMPDKTVKLFDYLDDKETVAQLLFEHGIVVNNLSKEGETLEDYFISVIGGEAHV